MVNNGDTNCDENGKETMDLDKGKQIENVEKFVSGEKYKNKYPEPLANYKDVVADRNLFMDTLGKMHVAMGTRFMIPTIGGKELDLHQLFVEVTSRGGINKVVGDRRWREVTSAFNFPATATNASFVLRKYYTSLIGHYEQIYFFRLQGWNSPPFASQNTPSTTSFSSERFAEPISHYASNAPSVQKRKANEELTPPGRYEPINEPVVGVIDGKIEHGYLVTVTLGTQKLRGVVFHAPEQQLNVNQATGSSGVVKRRRRRKKLCKRDPTHPKPNRSGYNFFFSEQHARLKSLNQGKDREISRQIGELWNKLTVTEKAVYQERGVKDKERYVREMAVYKERLILGPVINNAVPLQQRPAADLAGKPTDSDSKMEIDDEDEDEEGSDEGHIVSGSNYSSETEGKKSEENESELETSVDVHACIGSTSLAGAEGDGGSELKKREDCEDMKVEAEDESQQDGDDLKVEAEAESQQDGNDLKVEAEAEQISSSKDAESRNETKAI